MMEQSLNLLDQIIEIEVARDEEFKKEMISQHRGTKALGESRMLFYLKNLRELMVYESSGPNLQKAVIQYTEPYSSTQFPNNLYNKRVIVYENGQEKYRGSITKSYLCMDDCAGFYGKPVFEILGDDNQYYSPVLPEDCDFLN